MLKYIIRKAILSKAHVDISQKMCKHMLMIDRVISLEKPLPTVVLSAINIIMFTVFKNESANKVYN